eukprot:PhF_6_TR37134/c1_g1_i2/m.54632
MGCASSSSRINNHNNHDSPTTTRIINHSSSKPPVLFTVRQTSPMEYDIDRDDENYYSHKVKCNKVRVVMAVPSKHVSALREVDKALTAALIKKQPSATELKYWCSSPKHEVCCDAKIPARLKACLLQKPYESFET